MSDEVGVTKRGESDLAKHLGEHHGWKTWGGFDFAIGRATPKWLGYEHRPEWKKGNA
ncbi:MULTISPECIES: hypothetical protein [unclassified Ensifer]|uniref:hypothetical protein n=1 Tax=unclassified Ensifer TaxID=2633371 RepID=UPI000A66F46F|nr:MULTISPECIES: hypothetical protein [unclassified Ensifer]